MTRHPELSLDLTKSLFDRHKSWPNLPKIFDLLTSFWLPFWQTTSTVTAQDEHSFETFLDLWPQDLPLIPVDVKYLVLWKAAIDDSKAHSARVHAISAAELKVFLARRCHF